VAAGRQRASRARPGKLRQSPDWIAVIDMIARLLLALLMMNWCDVLIAHPGSHDVIDHFSKQIAQYPLAQAPYIQRGIAYSNDGLHELALQDYHHAETLGDPIRVAFDLGVLHYRMGRLDEARAYLDRYLESFPEYTAALEYRARVLRDAGDINGSLADYRAFLRLSPRPNPGHYNAAASMLASLPEQGIADALALLDEGIARIGLLPQLQRQAVELELARQQPQAAVARMQTLAPALGDSPDWQVEMAELLLRVGDTTGARQQFTQALARLSGLRQTPARISLAQRANNGLAGIAGQGDAAKR
jgi:tetratricopeptide (TPR) repeat protein